MKADHDHHVHLQNVPGCIHCKCMFSIVMLLHHLYYNLCKVHSSSESLIYVIEYIMSPPRSHCTTKYGIILYHDFYRTVPSQSLTLVRTCAAKGYCSRSVGRSVNLFLCRSICFSARFLSNRGCCRCQT